MAIVSGGKSLVSESNLVFSFDPWTKPDSSGVSASIWSLSNGINPATEVDFDTTISLSANSLPKGHSFHEGSLSWGNVNLTTRFGSPVTVNVPAYITMYGFPNIHDDTKGDHNLGYSATGQIYCPSAGTYSFYLDGDDAFDLFVNNVKVSSWYGGHGFNGTVLPINVGIVDTSIVIAAAGWYNFRIRFTEVGGGFGIALGWKKPGDASSSLVPTANLRPFNAYNRISPSHFTVYGSGAKTSNTVFQGNGSDAYVAYTDNGKIPIGETFSVSAWVKSSNLNARYGIFGTRSLDTNGCWQLEVGIENGGTNRIAIVGRGTWIWESNDNAIINNTWTHICYTKTNNAELGGSMYVNGQLISPKVTTVYTVIQNNDPKVVGQGTLNNQHFPGDIGKVLVYNKALSAAEVALDFENTRSRFEV